MHTTLLAIEVKALDLVRLRLYAHPCNTILVTPCA